MTFRWMDLAAKAKMQRMGKPYIQGNDMSRYWFLRIRLQLEKEQCDAARSATRSP